MPEVDPDTIVITTPDFVADVFLLLEASGEVLEELLDPRLHRSDALVRAELRLQVAIQAIELAIH